MTTFGRRTNTVATSIRTDGGSKFKSYLLQDSSGARIVTPAWKGGPSVFRFLPGLNPDTGYQGFDACRVGDSQLGEWVYKAPVVQFAFSEGVSFCLQRENGDEDASSSPYCVLYNAMRAYAKTPNCTKYWSDMTDNAVQNRLIPKPDIVALIPVIVYHRGDKPAQQIEGMNSLDILLLKESVFSLIHRQLAGNWITGGSMDLVDPQSGFFFTIWNKENGTPAGISQELIMSQQGNFGYSMAFTRDCPQVAGCKYSGLETAALTPNQTAWYTTMARPWSNIIKFMSHEEQAELIGKYAPPGAAIYAFSDSHEEWITPELRKRFTPDQPRIGSAPVQGYSVQDQQLPWATDYPVYNGGGPAFQQQGHQQFIQPQSKPVSYAASPAFGAPAAVPSAPASAEFNPRRSNMSELVAEIHQAMDVIESEESKF